MTLENRVKAVQQVAVIGAGAWGSALAFHLSGKGLEVPLWVFEPEVTEQIRTQRENPAYLPGVRFPKNIHPSQDMREVVHDKRIVILVVPSHHMRAILGRLAPHLSPGVTLVSAAKGIENETLLTMSQVIEEVMPEDLSVHRAVLSGPSFSREVGQGLPTAVTVACQDREVSQVLQHVLASGRLRIYTSTDVIGVELGGALKNVIAIATGIADGLNLGLNARAALVTRGLAEISRLGVRMGANPLTFMGLAGLGDLVLTCTGDLSRNRTVGLKLGQGLKLAEILKDMTMVAEGVKTTRSAHDLARREGVDMPITNQVYHVLYEDKEPWQALLDLMSRDLKPEIGGYVDG